MARNDPQINIRIPEELKAQLDKFAKENRRSLTAEIVARLEQSVGTGNTDIAFHELAHGIMKDAHTLYEQLKMTQDQLMIERARAKQSKK